jgi:hypothetical protein
MSGDTKLISFESYLNVRFSGGKLDFTRVNEKMGFSVIQSSELSTFINTFRKFEALTWDQIHMDKGLDYKEYYDSVNPEAARVDSFMGL